MNNAFLKQEEIDALLNANVPEAYQTENDTEIPEKQAALDSDLMESNGEQDEVKANGAALAEQSVPEMVIVTDQEKDALGEIGNICMGSSATTLSLLLNQPVTITSPRVTISNMEELNKSFSIPHISICVHYTEGFSGYNLLIMKLHDAAVLADLMMGGQGTDISEEFNEISISAASEAMNQMIGAASTAMATMFSRTVNISPPETNIYHDPEDLKFTDQCQVVVVWFKMTIGSILDTQIMQVMDLETAREEASLILGQLSAEYLPVQEEPHTQNLPGNEEKADRQELDGEQVTGQPEAIQKHTATKESNLSFQELQQARTEPLSSSLSEIKKPMVASPGLEQRRLDLLLDIPLKITVLLGRTRWPIKDILELTPGSVVELQSLVDEPVEVLVNGTLVAMGEVVVVNENFGVRLTNIIKPEERLQTLGK